MLCCLLFIQFHSAPASWAVPRWAGGVTSVLTSHQFLRLFDNEGYRRAVHHRIIVVISTNDGPSPLSVIAVCGASWQLGMLTT